MNAKEKKCRHTWEESWATPTEEIASRGRQLKQQQRRVMGRFLPPSPSDKFIPQFDEKRRRKGEGKAFS